MMIDVARARRDTPGCDHVLHFNNAGASLMPRPVLDRVVSHTRLEAEIGSYEAEEAVRDEVEGVYSAVGRLIGCESDEVALTDSATRAWDMAFYSMRFGPGDRILTSRAAYGSNFIAYLHAAKQAEASVEPVPNDAHGQISLEALETAVDDRVKLIALTHVPTNSGLVNPAADVGRIAREAGIPFLLDGTQSVGQLTVDVSEIGCTMLAGTSRKYLRGPRGVGFLYAQRGAMDHLEPPFLDIFAAEWTGPDSYVVRPDARRFETWESNVAARLGFGAAVEYHLGWRPQAIMHFIKTTAALLRDGLAEIPGVTVTDIGEELCGIVTFVNDRVDSHSIQKALADQAINAVVSTRASTLLDMDDRGLSDVVRASVHYFNTEQEVDRFCDAVRSIVA